MVEVWSLCIVIVVCVDCIVCEIVIVSICCVDCRERKEFEMCVCKNMSIDKVYKSATNTHYNIMYIHVHVSNIYSPAANPPSSTTKTPSKTSSAN